MFFFFLFCFFFILFSILFKMSHILSFLMGVEMTTIYLLLFMMMSSEVFEYSYFFLIFLSFSVCESILGLILFVLLTRYHSKDYMHNLCLLKF